MNSEQKIGARRLSLLHRWLHSRIGRHYPIRFDPYAPTAYVTRKEIVIPHLNANVTEEDEIQIRGKCLHEIGHPLHQPAIFDVMDTNPLPAGHPLASLYNIWCDVHNESKTAFEFDGDAQTLSDMGLLVGRDVTERYRKQLTLGRTMDESAIKVMGCMVSAIRVEGTWNVGLLTGFQPLHDSLFPREVRVVADDVAERFRLGEVLLDVRHQDEYTLWQLAKDVYNYLYPDKDADEEVEKEREGREKGEDGEGNPADGESKPAEVGKGDEAEGEGEDAKGKSTYGSRGEDADEGERGKEHTYIDVTELLHTDHYEFDHVPDSTDSQGQTLSYTQYKEYRTYTPIPIDECRVRDYEDY